MRPMTFDDVPHIAKHLMEEHGLKGWTFEWDHSRRRAGCCWYGRKVISLSRHYVRLNVADRFDDILDTILHEIAHALTPGDHHGAKWKVCCERIGAVPKRCYDSTVVSMPKGNWVATCPTCRKTFTRHRPARRNRVAYCIVCGPDKGRLEFVNTAAHPSRTSPVTIVQDTHPTPTKLRGQ